MARQRKARVASALAKDAGAGADRLSVKGNFGPVSVLLAVSGVRTVGLSVWSGNCWPGAT
jgi:hypothetical protein